MSTNYISKSFTIDRGQAKSNGKKVLSAVFRGPPIDCREWPAGPFEQRVDASQRYDSTYERAANESISNAIDNCAVTHRTGFAVPN